MGIHKHGPKQVVKQNGRDYQEHGTLSSGPLKRCYNCHGHGIEICNTQNCVESQPANPRSGRYSIPQNAAVIHGQHLLACGKGHQHMDCDREGDNLVATRMDTSTGKKTNLTPRRGLPGDGGWVGPVAGLPTRVADGLDVPPPPASRGLKAMR